MARAKKKAPAKMKAGKTSKISTAIGVGKAVLGLGSSKTKGKGGRRKKSAMWYAKEIQRVKLKKRYEKLKLGLMR